MRVCADPDNLPQSHADGSGFEDRIAAVLARELGRPMQPHWMPLRRGVVRKTLGEGTCDMLVGVPAGFEGLTTTRPYYRSTYVFVDRADDPQPLQDFDDPRLPTLRIGVQLVGDDLAATPAGYALARRGAVKQVVGYPPYGEGPAVLRMLKAVRDGALDAALVWGPQAGRFAAEGSPPLKVVPARPPSNLADVPFEYDIAVGVRQGDVALRDALQRALDARRAEIDGILAQYQVPRVGVRVGLGVGEGPSAQARAKGG